ncbi:MAG: hypothetical protein DSY57_02105 [Desulfobulbus sp.]|nr:MAG: hypothetical protein DSY57_02105 [Desulfobulbus sp.]
MLRKPHTRYHHLYVYYLDSKDVEIEDDPDLIGIWIEDDCAILFFHQPRDAFIDDLCRRRGIKVLYQADLDYRDWEAGVDITSFATRSLFVSPVWEGESGEANGRRTIILDPSVIFGSGFHATTRLCLETLETLVPGPEAGIKTVLDLGTGTGLLAIAAAKLGAERVVAVDNNPLAIAVARRNVEMNGCGHQVTILPHDLDCSLPDMHYDLVITNLYKGLLVRLFERADFWKARFYLVSGFIPGMEGELLAAMPQAGIHLLDRKSREQWRLWVLAARPRRGLDAD